MGVTKVFTQNHTTTGMKDAIEINGRALINLSGTGAGESGNDFIPYMQMQEGGGVVSRAGGQERGLQLYAE